MPPGHSYIAHLPVASTKEVPIALFPGEEGRISLVPDHVHAASQPGKYTAVFVLSRPGAMPPEQRQFDFSNAMTGDSHLAIAAPALTNSNLLDAVAIKIQTGTTELGLTFKGEKNDQGYLAKIQSDPFEAINFEDAESKAYHLLAPILSSFSAELDIPMSVFQVFVVEQNTSAMSSRIRLPALEVPLIFPPRPKIGAEFSYYASLYREALNSNSVVYRFLCFFKIIEGIRTRRKRMTQELLASGRKPIRLIECFPLDPSEFEIWLKPIYLRKWHDLTLEQIFRPESRGKKFNRVIDTQLVPLRNAVAHAILDSGELGVSADDLLKLEKIHYWLPSTRVIVRRMLRNEFPNEFLLHLPPTNDVEE
jgi:hypothetical protein